MLFLLSLRCLFFDLFPLSQTFSDCCNLLAWLLYSSARALSFLFRFLTVFLWLCVRCLLPVFLIFFVRVYFSSFSLFVVLLIQIFPLGSFDTPLVLPKSWDLLSSSLRLKMTIHKDPSCVDKPVEPALESALQIDHCNQLHRGKKSLKVSCISGDSVFFISYHFSLLLPLPLM